MTCEVWSRALCSLALPVTRKEDPGVAYEAVAKVWSPDGPWKTLIQTLLRKNGVSFEPY